MRIGSPAKTSSARAAPSPTRSESTSSPEWSRGLSRTVIQIPCPGSETHFVPPRPRPAVCVSAITTVPSTAPSLASSCATSIVDPTEPSISTRGAPSSSASPAAPTRSYSVASPTEIENGEHDSGEHEPVRGEDAVAVTRHVSHQDRDREPAADGRRDDADDERRAESVFADRFRNLEKGRGGDDRHAHEKAERRRALAIEPKAAAGGDRRAGARHAGNEREHLREADENGLWPVHAAQLAVGGAHLVGDPKNQSHHDERRSDERRTSERVLGFILEQQAANRAR